MKHNPTHNAKDVPLNTGRWAMLGFIVGSLITLIIQLPALWCVPVLNKLFEQNVLFTNVQGTLWKGSTDITLSAGAGSKTYATLPSPFAWQVHLTLRGLILQMTSDCCLAMPLTLTIAPSLDSISITLSDTPFKIPPQLLKGLGPPWSTLNLGGTLSITPSAFSATISSKGLTPHGTVSITASDVNSALSTLSPLGSYTVLFKSPGPTSTAQENDNGFAGVSLNVHTMEGLLNIEGSGQWTTKGLTFKGLAKTTPEYTNALSNLLNIMGKRDGSTTLITIG